MTGDQTLTLKLKVDDQGTVVLDQFTRKIETMGKSVQSSLSLIKLDSLINLGERALRAVGQQIYEMGRNVASAANDIERNARTLNLSTEAYQKWVYAARMADVETEELMNGFRFITRSIGDAAKGTGDAAKAFDALGVKLTDTAGKTKNQETVFLETIDALNKYADGANRDNLMLEIFGRSWMTLKPLVNQGSAAIREAMEEAKRLGIVLGDDVIGKGSEAENTFKKLEAQVQATKIGLAGAALNLAKFFKDALDFAKDALSYMARLGSRGGGISPEAWGGKPRETWALSAAELYGIGGPEAPAGKKAQAPAIAGAAGKAGSTDTWAKVMGAVYGGEANMYDYGFEGATAKLDQLIKRMEEENRVAEQVAQTMADDMFPSLEKVNGMVAVGEAHWKALNAQLAETQAAIAEMDWESVASGQRDLGSETEREINQQKLLTETIVDRMQQTEKTMQSIGRTIGDTLMSNMTMLLSTTDRWGEKFKKVGESILQTIAQMIVKTTLMNALFGSSSGEYKSGQGLVGMIGSALGSIKIFGEGGIVNQPTAGIIGDKGPEAVIPLRDGKIPLEGGGATYIQVINASMIDARGFDELTKRYSESIIGVNQRSMRAGGTFRKVVRGA